MAISSRNDRPSGPVLRSLSYGRFDSLTARASTAIESSASSLSAMAADFAMSSGLYSRSSTFFGQRPSSPTRVNLSSSPPQQLSSSSSSSSVRFSIDRPASPKQSFAASPRQPVIHRRGNSNKQSCMCSPTTHPGSFRCSLHKHSGSGGGGGGGGNGHSDSFVPNRLIMLRSAMRNRIVSIGGVEGDLMIRALTALIRPSSHQQKRRAAFQSRSSRLSAMSKAGDL
ncbi:uncharacterized protein LOC104439856 [Eucalyptus grandis]|uniref:uncharacterized protein LOC104439856 n=1 Tax=Eucalyptus grandis TaxID=71139 RepID=UPI00192EE75D|nr:uncharacterized protein LOC104439856 [Eucalyptus grandis]